VHAPPSIRPFENNFADRFGDGKKCHLRGGLRRFAPECGMNVRTARAVKQALTSAVFAQNKTGG
jgi:hypothetical protein